MLLSTPFPLLYPHRYAVGLARHSRLALAASLSTATSLPCHRFYTPVSTFRQRSSFSIRAAEEFHSGRADRVDYEQRPDTPRTANSWPEWSRFVEHVTTGAYGTKRTFLSAATASGGDDDDSLVSSFDLPDDFARAAEACLAFARERPVLIRLLSKRNVKVLVDNGHPFLFNNGLNSIRRMAHYLSNEGVSLSGSETAQTVDLMRYLLSYAYSQLASSKAGSFTAIRLVETSVNDLLNDMVNTSSPVQDSRSQQTAGISSQDIEMKRGDWICPKCSYMNFARNMKCLKCDEGRPKRQLTGGEWECPQCDFYNYGRNKACLRCDCKRPMSASQESTLGYMRERDFGQIHNQGSSSETSGIERALLDQDGKAERWFGQVAEPRTTTVFSNIIADKDFSETIPPQKESNDSNCSRPQTDGSGRLSINISDKGLDSSITRGLERILGQSSSRPDSTSTSQKKDNTSIPFVPLPPDMFKNKQNMQRNCFENEASSAKADVQGMPSKKFQDGHSGSSAHHKSRRDFNGDTEIYNLSNNLSEHDDKEQASSVSDDEFPEIMPMRKGENRFVVSRKKDRSLTSPQYKRRLAMEQAGGSNFVPFVPFPPGYFARKDAQGGDGVPTTSETVISTPGRNDIAEATDPDAVTQQDATQSAYKGWKSESFGKNPTVNRHVNPASAGGFNSSPPNYGTWNKNETRTTDIPPPGSFSVDAVNSNTLRDNNNHKSNFTSGVDLRTSGSAYKESPSSWNGNQENWNSGFAGKNMPNDMPTTPDSYGNKNEQRVNRHSSWNSSNSSNTDGKAKTQSEKTSNWGFTGKSLEGSAVPEEPDPLDMSEEAKAQRWFRRVAQITDISELSNIPDEDFPEIMPMRKGVNRFVVSKRKTPLERRLTSPQYRRNLPIVTSDPEKDSNKKF